MGSKSHEKSPTIQFEQSNHRLQYNTDNSVRSASYAGKINETII